MLRRVLLVLTSLLPTATPLDAQDSARAPQATGAVERLMQRWAEAWSRDDSAAIVAMAASGVVLHHGRTYRGPEGFREWMRAEMPRTEKLSWEALKSGASGDLAYQLGRWSLTLPGGGTAAGTHAFVWRRQRDGNWKLESASISNDP